MRYLSVCSGIGSDQVAAPAHWSCAGFAEIDPFARAVLAHRFPKVPLHDDFTALDTTHVGPVDLVVGGTPCQSFSVAGKRAGLDDPRGNLSIEFIRLGIRVGAPWLFWENVPGVLSVNGGKDFETFLQALGDGGYIAAWRVLDAQYFGVPQRRRRVYVVACRDSRTNVRDVASVLFESKRSARDFAPRRADRQAVTATPVEGIEKSSGSVKTDQMTFLWHKMFPAQTTNNTENIRDDQCVPETCPVDSWWDGSDVAAALDARMINHRMPDGGRLAAVIQADQAPAPYAVRTAQTGARGHGIATGVCHTLDSSNGQAVVSFDAYNNQDLPALNVANPLTRNGCAAAAITDEPVVGSDVEQSVVRRLTPVECERLQGLPDDWTAIPFRGRTVAADLNRYKAIGNGWAVPVVRWILDRLDRVRAGQSI